MNNCSARKTKLKLTYYVNNPATFYCQLQLVKLKRSFETKCPVNEQLKKKQSAETYKRNPGPKKIAFKTTYAKNAVSIIWN